MVQTKKFKKLLKAVKKQYLGKPVEPKYQKKYGKVYDEKEVKSVAIETAKKMGWRV